MAQVLSPPAHHRPLVHSWWALVLRWAKEQSVGDAGRVMKRGGEADGNDLVQTSTSWLRQVLHPRISPKHIL